MAGRRTSDDLKEVIRDFRRDQVIDVARRLFGERGSTDVSMDEIASEAGVARSTVYVYFANRDELLRACLQRMHAQLTDGIARTWEREAEPAQRLGRLIEEMLARVDDSPAFFRLALVTQGTPDRGAEAVGTELALISLSIAELIRDVVVEGIEPWSVPAHRPRSGHHPHRPAGLRSDGRPGRGARHPRPGTRPRPTPCSSSSTACRPETSTGHPLHTPFAGSRSGGDRHGGPDRRWSPIT